MMFRRKKYEVRIIYTGRGIRKPMFSQKYREIILAKSKSEAIKKVEKHLPKDYKIWSIWRLKKVI